MKQVVILNKKTGKRTTVSEERAKAILSNPILNPFGRNNLVIDKERTFKDVPSDIKKQVAKKEQPIKEDKSEIKAEN